MTDEELSDYLPLVLEVVSVAPLQISVNLFASFKEPIEKLKHELEQVGSPYSQLIEACWNGVGVGLLEKSF
jgi:nitrate reductase molybdenum cofactor assembly chaperone NarJ/NarW